MSFQTLTRVALVDDDDAFRAALAERLELAGLTVIAFASGDAALRGQARRRAIGLSSHTGAALSRAFAWWFTLGRHELLFLTGKTNTLLSNSCENGRRALCSFARSYSKRVLHASTPLDLLGYEKPTSLNTEPG